MARIAATLGKPLMPWQRLVADVAGEFDPATGELAYDTIVVTVPRQSGKSTLILGESLDRCLGFSPDHRQRVVYAAQNRTDAKAKLFDDWLPVLASSPFGSMYEPRLSTGSEAFMFGNGSMFEISANTEKAGHGRVVDVAFLDEAFALRDSRLEQAFSPAMITRPSPQLWVVSTAGTGDSTYLWSKVERGRAAVELGETSGVAYFEWSAADDAPIDDPETWWSCMPALGHTITEDAVRQKLLGMDAADFMRAFLNRWTTAKTLPPIPLAAWSDCRVDSLEHGTPLTFGVDVSPDRNFATVVAGSRVGDDVVVEVAESGRDGVEWVAPWLAERWRRWSPSAVWLDPAGPAGSLIPELVALGVKVETTTARDMGQACAGFYDAVLAGRVRHNGDPLLTAALGSGVKRFLGDLWLWSRTNASADITPAVAATLAVWGCRAPVAAAAPVFAY